MMRKKNNQKGTKYGTKDQRFGIIYVTAVLEGLSAFQCLTPAGIS